MNLKLRIASLFSLFVFIILMASSVTIFILNENFRKDEFFKRVENEAKEASELFFKRQQSRSDIAKEIDLMASSSLPEQDICIFDSSFHILFSTSNYNNLPVPARFFAFTRKNKEYQFTQNEREKVMLYIKGQGQPYYVLASATDVYGNRKIDKLKFILSFTVLGGLLLSGLLAFLYVKQIMKPLENLQQHMQRINEKNLTERVRTGKNHDEVSQIAKNFNAMLDRLEQAFEMRKSFVQHASHELRTPMANMLAQTEAALSKPLLPENYRQILLSLKEDQQDMINLMNALLILSQYEKITYLKDWSKIRIDEVLYEAMDFVKQLWPNSVIAIDFSEVPEKDEFLKINGNESLLRSAIQNLFKNACQYSEDYKVKVTIDANKTGITLLFDNIGKQLSAHEQERLFIPFFRGENSKNKKGFGLGLSIVQRIITLHKGSINYKSIENKINRFTVFFPLELQ
ncbi:MAG: HAMP domain-containing sensor histidine kinase [Acidimicrobiales bacterium]